VQTTRLAESFELLTRSVELIGPDIFQRKTMCNPVVLVQKSSNPTRRQSVKRV